MGGRRKPVDEKWVVRAKELFARKQDLSVKQVAKMLVCQGCKSNNTVSDIAEILTLVRDRDYSPQRVRLWLEELPPHIFQTKKYKKKSDPVIAPAIEELEVTARSSLTDELKKINNHHAMKTKLTKQSGYFLYL